MEGQRTKSGGGEGGDAKSGKSFENNKNSLPADTNVLLVGVVVALLLVLITLLIRRFGRGRRGRDVCLVGGSGAGKTAVFVALTSSNDGEKNTTLTSINKNEAPWGNAGNSAATLRILDLPGNPRVWRKNWQNQIEKNDALRGAVLVVDAAGGAKSVRDAAEVLFDVLSSNSSSLPKRILVLANKQDLPTAKSKEILKTLLEREITTLRMTRAAGLLTTAGGQQQHQNVGSFGRSDKDFEFAHLKNIQVEFAESVGVGEEADISALTNWLNYVAS